MSENILDHLPDLGDDDDDSEVIGKYYSDFEAQMAAARLRSEGVPCFLANVNTNAVLASNIVAIRLHVKKEFADKARDILTDAELENGELKNGDKRQSPSFILFFLAVLVLMTILYWLGYKGRLH